MSIYTHTALHVLKGAVQRVLGAKWTASVYADNAGGRLTVSFSRKSTEEEILQIESLANAKIREGQRIEELEMDRKEAERRWGDAIYDIFPVPTHIKTLRILNIEGWNVNACKEQHCKCTSEVGKIKIENVRYRNVKQLMEISFTIEAS